MVLKIIEATQAKSGATILLEGDPYTVRSNDISKTGKHGHAKCRIEAVGIFSDKKKVLAVPGHERFEVPMIDKRKAQVLSVAEGHANVMDLESFETLDLPYPPELKDQLEPEKNVEYWDVEGQKGIRRII